MRPCVIPPWLLPPILVPAAGTNGTTDADFEYPTLYCIAPCSYLLGCCLPGWLQPLAPVAPRCVEVDDHDGVVHQRTLEVIVVDGLRQVQVVPLHAQHENRAGVEGFRYARRRQHTIARGEMLSSWLAFDGLRQVPVVPLHVTR
jgi:hypothetical protein